MRVSIDRLANALGVVITPERESQIISAIGSLPELQGQIIEARFGKERLENGELCSRLGISPDQLVVEAHNALAALMVGIPEGARES